MIHRTDLAPMMLDIPAVQSGEAGAVVVGNSLLSTQELPLPEWFSMESVRQQLATSKVQAEKLTGMVANATSDAAKAREKLSAAAKAHESAKALYTLAVSGYQTARQDKERLDQLVATERRSAEAQARKDLEKLRAALTALGQEERGIREGLQQTRQPVREYRGDLYQRDPRIGGRA